MATDFAEELTLLLPRIETAIARYNDTHETKLKKKDIAAHLGITNQYLSSLLKGDAKNPGAELLFKMAKLLECKVDDLYEYKEDE